MARKGAKEGDQMAAKRSAKTKIVAGYAQMWPREVFDIREGKKKLLDEVREKLDKSGVYILYRDDQPYYVGKTRRPLFDRIWAHANASRDKYYNFWNFFRVFEVPDASHLSEIEGILIVSMHTSNGAIPSIERIILPRRVVGILGGRRRIDAKLPKL
jgi:hypothetical protein